MKEKSYNKKFVNEGDNVSKFVQSKKKIDTSDIPEWTDEMWDSSIKRYFDQPLDKR